MERYSSKVDSNLFNISIDGLDIIAEDINPTESFNRRETIRKQIIGGTQQVVRGGYIPRDNTIITHFMIDPLYPDVYDDIFMEWMSKPVEIISRELGGKFDAELIIKKIHNDSPNFLRLEIQIIEIPSSTSNILNDSMKVPTDEITSINVTQTTKTTSNAKKTTSSKNSKNTKKTDKNNKKKGSNITKTK